MYDWFIRSRAISIKEWEVYKYIWAQIDLSNQCTFCGKKWEFNYHGNDQTEYYVCSSESCKTMMLLMIVGEHCFEIKYENNR
jgi:hypothetical protein